MDNKERQKPPRNVHARLDQQKAYRERNEKLLKQSWEITAEKKLSMTKTVFWNMHSAHAQSRRLAPTMFYIRLVLLLAHVWYVHVLYMYMYKCTVV